MWCTLFTLKKKSLVVLQFVTGLCAICCPRRLLGMIDVTCLNIQGMTPSFANASDHSETLAKQSCTSLLRSSGKPHLIIISLYGDELYMQRVLRVKVSTTYPSKAFPKSTFGAEDYSLKNKTKQKTMQAKSWIIMVAGHLWSTYYRPDIILINSFN